MLASIDHISDASKALERGYVPTIVVAEHNTSKSFKLNGSSVNWIPCPAQTEEQPSCASCKLCFDDDILRRKNYGIAFSAHGARKNLIKRKLKMI